MDVDDVGLDLANRLVVEAQVGQGALAGRHDVVLAVPVVPQLGGDPQILAPDAAGDDLAERPPDLPFVAVDRGGVEVAVAQGEGVEHGVAGAGAGPGAEHPEPDGGEAFERQLTRYLGEESNKQIGALAPGSDDYREIVGGAWKTMIGYGDAEAEIKVPLVAHLTVDATPGGEDTVIWVDGGGKSALFREDGEPGKALAQLLETGAHIVIPDLFMQGEYLSGGEPATDQRIVNNPREFAGFTFGYNHPLFAQRVHDILNLIAQARGLGPLLVPAEGTAKPTRIHLIGTGGAGPWVAAAAAVAEGFNGRVYADTGGFRFAELTSYRDPNFLPGAVKYGDLPGLLALLAEHPLWLAGEKTAPEKVTKAFETSKTEVKTSSEGALTKEAIEWLLK